MVFKHKIFINQTNSKIKKYNKEIYQKYYKNDFESVGEMIYAYKHQDTFEKERTCPVCGKRNKFFNNKYYETCSRSCAQLNPKTRNKIRNTCLTNIDENGLNSYQRQTIHTKQTKKTRYGNENFNNREKCKLTNLEKYGVEYTLSLPSIRKKIIDTNMKKYNVNTPAKLKFVQDKIKETINREYNGIHPLASKKSQLKLHKTMLERYGKEFYLQTNEFKQYHKKIMHNKYNVNSPVQIHINNFENLNEQFVRKNFIKNNRFLMEDFIRYFNIQRNAGNVYKHKFNIIEPNFKKLFKQQQEVYDYIKSIYNGNILFNIKNIIKPLELDIYIPDKNVAIEFNGLYWHSINSGIDKYYHQLKSFKCKEKGIRLIHIYEDEWLNENKQKIIKDIIKHALNIKNSNENKIYARKCIIKEIDNNLYNEFCNNNHIQGSRGAQVKLGLFYNDELVQIASFGKSRFNKYVEWEWVRGCPASNNNVIGGTSKLFSYFVKNYKPKSVLCYADFNKFDGKGYKECGFEFEGFTSPNKFYFDLENHKRLERSPSKYKEYMQNVKNGKFLLLYGAGNLRFIYKNKSDKL